MGDRHQEVEVTRRGRRVGISCLETFLGIILFFASIFLLFWYETSIDLSYLARKSIEITATEQSSAASKKLVSVSGAIASKKLLGDNLFLMPGRYIFIDRTVEMYAWDEDKKTEKNGSKKTTNYTYHKRWKNNPKNSSEFRYAKDHENPIKFIPDQFDKVAEAQIEIYNVDMINLTTIINHQSSCTENQKSHNITNSGGVSLPANSQLQLSQENIKLTDGIRLMGKYLYKGAGTTQKPQIGDLRICYRVLPVNTTVTIFGQIENPNRIVPYSDQKSKFYRLVPKPRQEAILWLTNESDSTIWMVRGIGCFIVWFGLDRAGTSVRVIRNKIPFLGKIIEGITSGISLIVALSISLLTILVARLTHDPIVLLVVLWLTLGLTLFLRYKKRQWQQ